MITIKLPYNSTDEFQDELKVIRKQYSCVVRYAYNRFNEEREEKEVRSLCKNLNNIDLIDSWIVQCAILEGKQLNKRFKDKKNIIFGDKYNFIQRLKGKITKEEFGEKRLSALNVQGEKLQKGNRKFNLDIIENNKIVFKLNLKKHFDLQLPKLRKNVKKDLYKLQQLNEKDGHTYSIELTDKDVSFMFEEFKSEEKCVYNENRYVGIDLNPSNIGISVCEYKNGKHVVILAKEFDLSTIVNKILNLKVSSSDPKSKHLQGKLNHEIIEISKRVANITKQFNCKTVFVEELKFKQKVENKYNNVGNRKNKNLWKKALFINNLKKRLNILSIDLWGTSPAYTSFIGNLKHEYTDSINASIEIGRRGFEYRILKNKNSFYPIFTISSLKHQWKETANECKDWKELFLKIKNLKLKYRVSLIKCKNKFNVLSINQFKKSNVRVYNFYV